jgi:hypothetical protein
VGDLRGNAAPEPPTTTPEPYESAPATILALPAPRPLTYGQAIRAVYELGERRTCQDVADLLARCPLDECDEDGLAEIADALAGCAQWHLEHVENLAHRLALHAKGPLLFCTAEEVLVCESPEKRWQIYRWETVAELMKPHIEEAQRVREKAQRRREAEALLKKRFPPKRKLKAVQDRVQTLIKGGAVQFNDARVLEYIQAMTGDDPRFADCKTLKDYLNTVWAEVKADQDKPVLLLKPPIPEPGGE